MVSDRKKYIDFIKIVSSFSVVLLHTNGCFWDFSYDRYWITANIIESVFYCAVPLFFMVAGVTLIDYKMRYDTKEYFSKRFRGAMIPFLFWSVLAFIYWLIVNDLSIKDFTFINILSGILNTEYRTTLWFFIPLFGVYMAIPFISYIPEEMREKAFRYLIIVSLIVNCLIPFICNLIGIQYNYNLQVPVSMGYILFVYLGYYLDHYSIGGGLKI